MMDQNEYSEIFNESLLEYAELLEEYERNLMELEAKIKEPGFTYNQVEDNIQAIFRSMHTVKSIAGMMEFTEIKDFSHHAEDLLDHARYQEVPIDDSLIDLLFEILDITKKLAENLIMPDANPVDIEEEIEIINNFIEISCKKTEVQEIYDELPEEKTVETVKRDTVSHAPGLTSNTIRVDTHRLDKLLDTVGEIVIGKNQLLDVSKTVKNVRLSKTLKQFKRLIIDLQEWSMKLRMTPISHTFNKLKRPVRDLAKSSGKEVNLIIEGETTEVDRAIIESMENPLLHIIRNSIDHGIEIPEERELAGKGITGTLKLKAYQERSSIAIEISDDGQGIDTDKVYRKALNLGLIDPEAKLSQRDMINLLFLPGFSTAEKVTDVSGRGVGMDVVKKNIVKLNGTIDIESEMGKGTTVILKLPLTLAIIRVLLVEVGKESYSIPINNIIETLSYPATEVYPVNGYDVIHLRNQVLPLIRLDEVLDVKSDTPKDKDRIFVIVAAIGEKQVGFVVDRLVDQLDIVIKPLGAKLENIPGVSGATILGNGQISLVLDLITIWREELSHIQSGI